MDTRGFDEYQKSLKEKFEELEDQALHKLKVDQTAYEIANETAQQLVDDEHIFKLTDDEVDLLKAYRSQRQRKARGLFRWRYSTKDMIVTPENPLLIVDPRNESE